MKNDPRQMVEKALLHIEANYAHAVSVSRMAQKAGCSRVWFTHQFKAVTGKSVKAHIVDLRLRKAKELLSKTTLEIGEIALDTGFAGYHQFANLFKKKEGMSAQAFRQASANPASTGSAAVDRSGKDAWFRDSFKGQALAEWWSVDSGDWRQNNGQVEGRSTDDGLLVFNKPLPENYRASFEISFLPEQAGPYSDFHVALLDPGRIRYCQFAVGSHGNSVNVSRRFGQPWQWSLQALAQPNSKWQLVVVEVGNEDVRLWLNNKCVFHFRDPFPPAYVTRSRLGIGCWKSAFAVRNLVIDDMGFPFFVPSIRQGDTLYRGNFYEEALHFYQRQMGFRAQGADMMETRYKAGMCQMRLSQNQAARESFESVATLPEYDFWSQQARLGLLELEWRTSSTKVFLQRVRELGHIPVIRDGLRNLATRATLQYSAQGFISLRLEVFLILLEIEEPESPPGIMAHIRAGQSLVSLREYKQAEIHFGKAGQAFGAIREDAVNALHEQAYMLAVLGKRDQSRATIATIRAKSQFPDDLARCYVHEALNLRGQGSLDEALSILEMVSKKYRNFGGQAVAALQQQSQIHCILGDVVKAGKVLEECRTQYPGNPGHQPGWRIQFWGIPLIAMDHFRKSAELYAEDLEIQGRQPVWRAYHAVGAGILFCLAGEEEKAQAVWHQVGKRFPQKECNGYAAVARNLMQGKQESFEKIYHPAYVRANLFYLMGLLKEKQGDTGQAGEWYRKCVTEDGTGGWGASFSKRKLRICQERNR